MGATPPALDKAAMRELIEKHQRREAELEALYDAAGDLSRVRDVERTLRAVTQRAHRLMRCDVTYLSAAVEDGGEDFAVRAWSGQLSPKFLGTKVSTGSGVGGQIAESRRPFQVQDYLGARNITHTAYLDAQVGAEGIVSLLGVPMEVDGRLLGILFAGRRQARLFDDDEVRLLSSLAAHAAVALDNAALFAAQLAALAELGRTAEALRAHSAAVETAAEVHARLTDVVLHGQGVQAIVDIVADALGVDMAMIDPAEVLVAAHGCRTTDSRSAPSTDLDSSILPPLSDDVRRAVRTCRATGRCVEVFTQDGRRVYVQAAAAGPSLLGSVLLESSRKLTDVDVRTFERATQTIAVSLLSDAAAAEADRRASSEVMRQLLAVRHTSPQVVERIARRHLLTGGPVTVVVTDAHAVVAADRVASLVTAASRLCTEEGGLSAVYDDHLVLLQPGEERVVGERAWTRLCEVARQPITLAVGRPTRSLLELGDVYAETVACLRLMHRVQRKGTWATTAEFGMYSLLFSPDMADRLDHFVRGQAGPLLDYDARHDTQPTATALAYLDSASSPAAAAKALGIHANTVAQRLGRIDRVLGADWRSSPRSLEVHTALRLDRLRDGLRR